MAERAGERHDEVRARGREPGARIAQAVLGRGERRLLTHGLPGLKGAAQGLHLAPDRGDLRFLAAVVPEDLAAAQGQEAGALLALDLVRLGLEPRLHLVLQLAHGSMAGVGRLREGLEARALERDRDFAARRALAGRLRVVAEDGRQRRDRVRSGEGPLEREGLVHHDAERPDVGALVDRHGRRLLGRHVARGPDDFADARVIRARSEDLPVPALHHLRETPVEDLDLAVLAEHDVRGLEVAMEHAARMREVDRLCDLEQHLHEPRDGVPGDGLRVAPAQAAEHVGERAAPDVAHRAERGAVVHDERVERNDVRVLELAEDAHLVEEARAARGVVALGHLERDLPPERGVAREEHRAHAALGDQALDFVTDRARRVVGRVGPRGRRGNAGGRPVRRRGERFLFGGIALVSVQRAS